MGAGHDEANGGRPPTSTSAFGSSRRERHDSSMFYARFPAPRLTDDDQLSEPFELPDSACFVGDARNMEQLPDNSVALVVTSPPYFVGKEYEQGVSKAEIPSTYIEYLEMLRHVFSECLRVLEPGGRMAVNVANLGRKPYRSLAADIIAILQDDLGMLLRGEVVWQKADGASGSIAWGSFRRATNPVLRDITERVIIASNGRFDRAVSAKERKSRGLPHESSMTTDEFMESTLDVWRIDSESARRVNHPAPFPVELPQRLIELYTYEGDLVLDPFLGSGSTLVAARRAGRRGVGYELDPEYVEIAHRRLVEDAAESGPRTEREMRAVAAGKTVRDLALRDLEAAGFRIVDDQPKLLDTGVQFDFSAEGPGGSTIYVEVAGGFTTARPGLVRAETLWKTIGKAHVFDANMAGLAGDPRLIVMTAALPRPGSGNDRALRSLGPSRILDVVEILDDGAVERLAQYANSAHPVPVAGFWSDDDVMGSKSHHGGNAQAE